MHACKQTTFYKYIYTYPMVVHVLFMYQIKSTRCDASEASHQLLGMLLAVQVCQLVGTVALQQVQVSCLGGVRGNY